MFINKQTLTTADGNAIRQAHPTISFPPTVTIEHVAELGYAELEYGPQPSVAPGEQLRPGEIREDGGRYVQGWVVVPASEPEYPAIIASRRYDAEIAGIELMGMRIDTGRDSQALITGATVQAMLDPSYALRWKTPDGFVDLTAEQIIGVATAARAHVQACFNREAELLEALEAGTFAPEMLDQGWP
ncbi:DUF4376 domain-containing protein [Stutzerimonas stutzeri]|uniref:DUF4376 domain-containing protein n=1 Tax=Stutzerimonas stutzeri TaxID=316 RepID=UPI0018AAA5F7|nr:DUF4376 domain-containing protein [Stutzerimonas stutzeri]QPI08258.1 DUF4376 domain-containing protein [Stutzerimonas stutzeri]